MQSIDDCCIWNTVLNDPESTTALDVNDNSHPLYKCLYCKDNYKVHNNPCANYISVNGIKNKELKREVDKLLNRYNGVKL